MIIPYLPTIPIWAELFLFFHPNSEFRICISIFLKKKNLRKTHETAGVMRLDSERLNGWSNESRRFALLYKCVRNNVLQIDRVEPANAYRIMHNTHVEISAITLRCITSCTHELECERHMFCMHAMSLQLSCAALHNIALQLHLVDQTLGRPSFVGVWNNKWKITCEL